MNKLPVFKGYTADIKLKQFRKKSKDGIEFIDFNSDEGDKLLSEFILSIDRRTKEGKELFEQIKGLF